MFLAVTMIASCRSGRRPRGSRSRSSATPEYHGATLPGQDFWLLVQRLGEGGPRVHVDIHTDDLAAEVERLERLGAERVPGVHPWQVMRDPAGLLFCVIPDPAGTLNEANARRWE